jgi:hypothetical protein
MRNILTTQREQVNHSRFAQSSLVDRVKTKGQRARQVKDYVTKMSSNRRRR